MFTDFLKFMNCCQENEADKNTEEQFKKDGASKKDQYQNKGQIGGR